MKVALALTLTILTAVVVANPRDKTPEKMPAPQDLNQIAVCVEAPRSVSTRFQRKFSIRSRCTLQEAISAARIKARDDAANELEPFCLRQITNAEANDVCRVNGRSLARESEVVQGSIPRPGGSQISDEAPISGTALCVTFRDSPAENLGTAAEFWCGPINNWTRKGAKFTTLARCGVKCFP